jgi:putative transcriptional regulator
MTTLKKRPDSGILASVHKTAAGLHKAGLVDKATMREHIAAGGAPRTSLSHEIQFENRILAVLDLGPLLD